MIIEPNNEIGLVVILEFPSSWISIMRSKWLIMGKLIDADWYKLVQHMNTPGRQRVTFIRWISLV